MLGIGSFFFFIIIIGLILIASINNMQLLLDFTQLKLNVEPLFVGIDYVLIEI